MHRERFYYTDAQVSYFDVEGLVMRNGTAVEVMFATRDLVLRSNSYS
jgi:hypothetical protein